MNKRKFFGTIIGIIFWSICIVFFTYAYYEWKSIDTSIVLGIQDLATKCSKGPDVTVTDVGPVFYPSDGVKAKFNLTNDLMTTQNFSIELNITSISDNLLVDSFKWMLIIGEDYDNPIEEGDFSNFKVGKNTIADILALESNTTKLYQFIVYIDGNMYNDPNMQNNTLLSYLEIGNCGIIAEANQMIGSSTDTFRNADYINNITRASFVDYTPFTETQDVSSQNNISSTDLGLNENSKIPSMLTDTTDLIYWDMSKYQDGRVIAWLEDAGTVDENGNTNYNLYIGSDTLTYLTNMSNFFNGMTNLTSISFDNIDTSLVTNMSYMFYGCSNLTSIDVSDWNTSNVTNMSYMFYRCSSLTSLDVSSFDTSKVTDMYSMFRECNQLATLDLSSFDTSKVTSMSRMFRECSNLATLNINNFDTSKVTAVLEMFYKCSSLINLDVSNWNTSSINTMKLMFYGCGSLTSLDLSSFNTSNVTNMSGMFQNCSGLIQLDVSSFNTSNVTIMFRMFSNCNQLATLDLNNFNTSIVTDMSYMFYLCSKLTTTIIIRNVNTTSYGDMFYLAATTEGSSITVNYTTETSSLVDEMLKTGTGNLIKPENPVPILTA